MQQQSRKTCWRVDICRWLVASRFIPVLLPANTSANTTALLSVKKKRRIRGPSGFIAKIFVYRDYFQAPAACTHSYQPHQF